MDYAVTLGLALLLGCKYVFFDAGEIAGDDTGGTPASQMVVDGRMTPITQLETSGSQSVPVDNASSGTMDSLKL